MNDALSTAAGHRALSGHVPFKTVRYAPHPAVALGIAMASFVFTVSVRDIPAAQVYLIGLAVIECGFGLLPTVLRTGMICIPAALCMAGMLWWISSDGNLAMRLLLGLSIIWIADVPMLQVPEMSFVRFCTQMRAPRIMALAMMISLRFPRMLLSQMHRIYDAWRVVPTGLGHGVQTVRMAVPLMSRVLSISDVLSMSLELRCFTLARSVPTSVYHPVGMHWKDWLLSVSALCMVCLAGCMIRVKAW